MSDELLGNLSLRLDVPRLERPAEGLALSEWLRRDPQVSQWIDVERAAPRAGELGTADVIVAAGLGPAGVAAFCRVVLAWIALQRQETKLRFSSGGAEIELEVSGKSDPEQLAREIVTLTRRSGGRESV
jgi:hypothetical protein